MQVADLVRLAVERPLSLEEAHAVFGEVMHGRATPVQMAALLAAIRARGAAPEEVAGGVHALREAMVPVPVPADARVVDTCGTGGGTLTTFNISTAAAILAAGAGVQIAKHGNRSFSSRCGSADVLEAMGVRIDLKPDAEARVFEEVGIVFMFAPAHHPAMRHVAPVRRELAMPTLMNVLGPLTNPAGARRQVVGVSDPALLELIASALNVLGHERALVVHGEPGIDELSPLGISHVVELADGALRRWHFDPQEELGWADFDAVDLAGGGPSENAALVEAVLKGDGNAAARAATVLNAAAAIYVDGAADSLTEAVGIAERALESGAGAARLEALRDATWRAA
jgi:anthranilate phosphoribosyltransferase